MNNEFKFQKSVYNDYYDLTILCLNLNNVVIITAKDVDYPCIFHDISKFDVIHSLESYALDDSGYI